MLAILPANKKSSLVSLRLCVAAATGALFVLYPPPEGLTARILVPWGVYLASSFGFLALPDRLFAHRRFDLLFVTLELALIVTMLVGYGGSFQWLFYPLFLLVILLAALSRRMPWALALGASVAVAYSLLRPGAWDDLGATILQAMIMLTAAGIVGYLTELLVREEETTTQFDNALEISTLLAESLDAEAVYDRLTEVVARLFHASRVSVVLEDDQGWRVAAAATGGKIVHDVELDDELRPEVELAHAERRTVLIDRVHPDPLAESRAGSRHRRSGAILVTPIFQGTEARGVVHVRHEDGQSEISPHEARFCRLMADVAGKALQRADHFAEVAEAARRDALTGLYNVRVFRQNLDEEIARCLRSGASCAVLMIDVDYLKQINDAYGHPVGDQVLRDMAGVLTQETRSLDTVARYGGEEFGVLLSETEAEDAVRVAERLRRRVAAIEHEGVRERVTVSIGVAVYPEDALTATDLVRLADQALYASKHQGRNRTARYDRDGYATGTDVASLARGSRHESAVVAAVRANLVRHCGHAQALRHFDVVASLATLMQARHPGSLEQFEDVATLTGLFVADLALADAERCAVQVACLLRDVGLVAIGDLEHAAAGRLTREEYEAIRRHPVVGAEILQPLRGLALVHPIVRHHHERWDGTGYPDGLREESIPYGARIVGLVDAFYAMVRAGGERGRAVPLDYACEEIRRNSGTQFDPHLAMRFLYVLDANRPVVAAIADRLARIGHDDDGDEPASGAAAS